MTLLCMASHVRPSLLSHAARVGHLLPAADPYHGPAGADDGEDGGRPVARLSGVQYRGCGTAPAPEVLVPATVRPLPPHLLPGADPPAACGRRRRALCMLCAWPRGAPGGGGRRASACSACVPPPKPRAAAATAAAAAAPGGRQRRVRCAAAACGEAFLPGPQALCRQLRCPPAEHVRLSACRTIPSCLLMLS